VVVPADDTDAVRVTPNADNQATVAYGVTNAANSAWRAYILKNGGAYLAGNVGIGTMTPPEKLAVYDGNAIFLRNSASTGFGFKIGNNGSSVPVLEQLEASGALVLRTAASAYLRFDTGGANERMRIDANGLVGIGTPSPANTLDVNGTAHVSGVLLVGQDITLNGALNKSIGGKLVDQGGCYYA